MTDKQEAKCDIQNTVLENICTQKKTVESQLFRKYGQKDQNRLGRINTRILCRLAIAIPR